MTEKDMVRFICHSMTGIRLLVLLAVLICSVLSQEQSEEYTPTLGLVVEHSLDHGRTFKPRTTAQLVTKADGRTGLIFDDKNSITGDDISDLKKLLKSNDLYTVRMKSSESSAYAVASIPAVSQQLYGVLYDFILYLMLFQCELQKSGFKEDIQVYMTGSVINGLAYSSPQMPVPLPCDPSKVKETIAFQTRIKLGEDVKVPPLPLQVQGFRPMYLKDVRLGVEEEKQQAQQQQGSQSFLSKYVGFMADLSSYCAESMCAVVRGAGLGNLLVTWRLWRASTSSRTRSATGSISPG